MFVEAPHEAGVSVPFGAHVPDEELEEYAFGRIHEPVLARLEEHILGCPECIDRLEEIEKYRAEMKAGVAAYVEMQRSRELAPSLGRLWNPAAIGGIKRKPATAAITTATVWMGAFVVMIATATLEWRSQPDPWHPAVVAAAVGPADVGAAAVGSAKAAPTVASLAAPPVTVDLIALRGGKGMAHATARRLLDVTIESRSLTVNAAYQVEMVNASGSEVWRGTPAVAGGQLVAQIPKSLRAGVYWVRLYINRPQTVAGLQSTGGPHGVGGPQSAAESQGPEEKLVREFGLTLE